MLERNPLLKGGGLKDLRRGGRRSDTGATAPFGRAMLGEFAQVFADLLQFRLTVVLNCSMYGVRPIKVNVRTFKIDLRIQSIYIE